MYSLRPCSWLRYKLAKPNLCSFKAYMPPTIVNSFGEPSNPILHHKLLFTKIPLAPTSLVVEEPKRILSCNGAGGWGGGRRQLIQSPLTLTVVFHYL